MFQLLLDRGAAIVDAVGYDGQTCLHIVSSVGKEEIVQQILLKDRGTVNGGTACAAHRYIYTPASSE